MMHAKLLQILDAKKQDVLADKMGLPMDELRNSTKLSPKENSFARSILGTKKIALIAEIKLATPAGEVLESPENILNRAADYESAGANAISFITERHFFNGDIDVIPKLKKATSLPVLQKDFILDEYQIYQSRLAGSDALLLIARIIDRQTLQNFVKLTLDLGMEPIVEVHNTDDLSKAVTTSTRFIAANARDLDTLNVDLSNACQMIKKIPEKFFKMGFSGVVSSHEVEEYRAAGARAVLVGTNLMKAEDTKGFIRELRT